MRTATTVTKVRTEQSSGASAIVQRERCVRTAPISVRNPGSTKSMTNAPASPPLLRTMAANSSTDRTTALTTQAANVNGGLTSPTMRCGTRLHEPVAHPPLMLQQEHAAELSQCIGPGVVERPEQALAILDRQRHDDGPEGEQPSEAGRGLARRRGERARERRRREP
jgi:hypothetical protein